MSTSEGTSFFLAAIDTVLEEVRAIDSALDETRTPAIARVPAENASTAVGKRESAMALQVRLIGDVRHVLVMTLLGAMPGHRCAGLTVQD